MLVLVELIIMLGIILALCMAVFVMLFREANRPQSEYADGLTKAEIRRATWEVMQLDKKRSLRFC